MSRSVLSPARCPRRGRPEHPRDLLAHDCIRHRFASGISPPWEFARDDEALTVAVSGPLVADDVDLEVEAALGGFGVITTFEGFLAPSLSSCRLVPMLEPWWLSFSGPFLYSASNRHRPATLRCFLDDLRRDQSASVSALCQGSA